MRDRLRLNEQQRQYPPWLNGLCLRLDAHTNHIERVCAWKLESQFEGCGAPGLFSISTDKH